MILDTETRVSHNWEIKRGSDSKGKTIFFLYIYDSRRYPGSATIEGPFRSEAEAVANANCMPSCGNRIY